MEEQYPHTEIEIDFYPDKESQETIQLFLKSLVDMAKALDKTSQGAIFYWKLKITAEGEWS